MPVLFDPAAHEPPGAEPDAHKGHKRTREQQRQYARLRRKLAQVEKTRLQPLS